MKYRIVRRYFKPEFSPKTLKENLSLEQAQEHCKDPETSSQTCKEPQNTNHTEGHGPWFDSYESEED